MNGLTLRRLTTAALKNVRAKHDLPELPYEYDALEPVISKDIMNLHHDKHHRTYVTNLNAAEEKLKSAIEKGDVNGVAALSSAIKFNGGGHINHSIFWKNLSPTSTKPIGELCCAIDSNFGSFDKFQQAFSAITVAVQGSGWGWLGYDPKSNSLQLVSMPNQDALEPTTGLIPLLGIDVWEHAYYLQYKNNRAAYVKAIFDIINWDDVSHRYIQALRNKKC
ncbi:superoxide dismutase [Mn], mitochondrial [Agrilus planipennis]|uniref:Superoxide dismutase n=1 Tax=Agrilus planipennis TaxID=224129 RepID=A0A7F5RC22_AGRPL|nr:superoxide dismutase [Mn], mitochondrial [Agrilus planipennis]